MLPSFLRLPSPLARGCAARSLLCRLAALASLLTLAACGGSSDQTFTILSGSENETLEPLVLEYCQDQGWTCEMRYSGSLDIMLGLSDGTLAENAVWPAHSRWIDLGDRQKRVRDVASIMRSPIGLGIALSRAEALGLVGRDVTWADLVELVRQDRLDYLMTSATQSNSGFSAYIGMLSALARPDGGILTMADLEQAAALEDVRVLLSGVRRTAGSSGWLKDLYLNASASDPQIYAMFNYEALILEANRVLVEQGREPLYAVYPVDGVAFADSPLGYVTPAAGGDPQADAARYAFFQGLQRHLLSPEVQQQLLELGRRTGFGGTMEGAPAELFRAEWGMNPDRVLTEVRFPTADVIRRALSLYQEALRKPSLLALCLDYSGSMGEVVDGVKGEEQLEQALTELFDPALAERFLLEPGENDVYLVYAFSDEIKASTRLSGLDGARQLPSIVSSYAPGGRTDMYLCAAEALKDIAAHGADQYSAAILILTDGQSEEANRDRFRRLRQQTMPDLPVFSITFGAADDTQLKALAEETQARVFNGRNDLAAAFRQARGYN